MRPVERPWLASKVSPTKTLRSALQASWQDHFTSDLRAGVHALATLTFPLPPGVFPTDNKRRPHNLFGWPAG